MSHALARPPLWGFALRGLRQDWRGGEIRLLALAVALAVAALTAVGFFTDRVRQGIELQGSELLGADLVLSRAQELPPELAQRARALGLAAVSTLSFRSMAAGPEELTLSEVKAVEAGYPLRGQLRLSAGPSSPDQATYEIPAPGTVWVEPRLLSLLELRVGDELSLGQSRLRVTHLISEAPDRGGQMFQLAPRVLLNLQDLPATGLLGPGSRVRHQLLLAGEAGALARFRAELAERVWPGLEVQTLADARPELRAALQQAGRFLSLAALLTVVLAGAAVAVAAHRYTQRQMDAAAILRCLGATQDWLGRVYLLRLGLLGLAAALVGSAVGYALQVGLSGLAAHLFLQHLPPPSWQPLGLGLATALLTLAGFALPMVWRVRGVSPLRVLRRDLGLAPPAVWQVTGLALLALGVLVYWQAGELKLAAVVLGGCVLTLGLLGGAAYALLRGVQGLRHHAGSAWRFGLINLGRRARASTLQLTGFGVGMMTLLLLAVVRIDLLDSWQTSLPADTPNYFLLNVQPADLPTVQSRFADMGVAAVFYPMLAGNLLAINDTPVVPEDYPSPRAQRLARRAFNLSWAEQMPEHNSLRSGAWWQGGNECSVETGIAETLGIKLGDRLQFRVGSHHAEVKVTSLRVVEWDSFRVNFFVIFSPEVLADSSASYLSSFHLPPSQTDRLKHLAREFPSLSVLEVGALVKQVRGVMERAVLAIEYVFGLTLLAGLLVLYAAIQASHEERVREAALMRTLGASRRQIIAALLAEFLTLGALAGLLAALAAGGVGYALARWVFDLGYYFNFSLLPLGLLAGTLGVGLAGILGTYSVLNRPPAQVLRQGE